MQYFSSLLPLPLHRPPAYGYGFLMVAFISIVSLAGIAVVPFLREGTRLGQYYKYIYALLIALGVSSLFCDAILHLIPHVSVCTVPLAKWPCSQVACV